MQADYQAGKAAFERGDYRKSVRHLEAAKALVDSASRLGGEIQIWLVTAYEAAGQRSEALNLCRAVSRHPDWQTRKQGKRLLYILEAPRLKTRPEWLTEIPDLTALSDSSAADRKGVSNYTSTAPVKRSAKPQPLPEPPDPTQVNLQDNRFIWVALGVTILTLGSLLWLS